MRKQLFVGTVGSLKKQSKGSITGNGEGVYAFLFAGNQLNRTGICSSDNTGLICCSHNHEYIYAANESKDFTGLNGSGGGVTAFAIKDNQLNELNHSISYGSRPSYVSVTEDDAYLLVSNHGSHTTVTCSYIQDTEGNWKLQRGFDESSVAVFRLHKDGTIGELTDLKVFDGHGYWCHGGGQSTSHIHSVKSQNGLVVACNRGADSLEVMRLDSASGKLSLIERFHTVRGYAPRHCDFHPNGKYLYVVNENYPSVSVYAIQNDHLCHLETIGTMEEEYYIERPLPHFDKDEADENEKNTCGMFDHAAAMPSDIHISADGKYVYASNRRFSSFGSIAVFCVKEDGTLNWIGNKELDGKDPRGFCLSEDGTMLIAGLMDLNKIVVFGIDAETGMLKDKINEADVNSPASCVMIGDADTDE